MIANLNLVHAPTVKFQIICILDHIHQHQYLRRKSYTFPSPNKLFGCSLLISHYSWLFFSCFYMQWTRLQWATYSSSYSFVTSYTEFEPVKIRSMAALCEGMTWLGQLIFQFLTCVIFRTEKDKVFWASTTNFSPRWRNFFDICGYKEREEQSTTVRECGASKGRGQDVQVEKKSRSRNWKSGLENNKSSPAEKVACQEKW